VRGRSVIGKLLSAVNLTPVAHTNTTGGLLTGMPVVVQPLLSAMSSTGTVFAIVNGLAESTAMAEWGFYRKAPSGRKEDRVPVPPGQHPAWDMWLTPNKHMTQMEFTHAAMQHMELVGETDWLIRYDPIMGKLPLDMWPIRPDRVRPIEDPDVFIKGWKYTTPSGQQLDLDTREILPLKLPNPVDAYRGMGAVQSVLHDIDSARYGAEWNAAFFTNGAVPGGVIEYPDKLSDVEFEEVRDRWNSGHKGVQNSHRVAIIERGKFVPTTFSMRDMQFAELRNVSTEVIRQAWRYPVAMLGTSDNVNRANAEAAMFMHASWMLVPRLCRLRGMLNTRFLPLFGADQPKRYEFDFASPVVDNRELEIQDRDSKIRAYQILVQAGVDSASACEVVGLPPMKVTVSPVAKLEIRPPKMLPVLNAAEDDPAYAEYEAALAELITQWESVTVDQRAELAEQIEQADGDLSAISEIAVTTTAAEAALVAALISLFKAFAALTVEDAKAAGVAGLKEAKPNIPELEQIAMVTAGLLGTALEASAVNEAMRLTTPTSTGAEVATAVAAFLATLSLAYPTQKLGAALWKAGALGVAGTVALTTKFLGFRSDETLDKNTCAPCREINGTVYSTWDDVINAGYATGGYHACEGRDRCRGRVKVVWNAS